MTNSEIPGIKIFVASESTPWRVELAGTPNYADAISGASIIDGDQSRIAWVHEGSGSVAPLFQRARGRGEAVTLYNEDGVYGGNVQIGDTTDISIPFWIRYRLDENSLQRTGFINLDVVVDEGNNSLNIATGEPPTILPPVVGYAPYNNPSGDLCIMLGSQSPGTSSLIQSGHVFHFIYNGTDTIHYTLDVTDVGGNSVGLARVYETTSDSWPIWNAGMTYLAKNGVTWTPQLLVSKKTLDYALIQPNNTLIVGYTNSVDSSNRSKYTYQLTGKSLRVTMESLDVSNTLYSGNYINASIGIASGCDNPIPIEIMGNGMTPMSIFDGPLSKYFYSSWVDPTQSNAQWALPPDPRPANSGSTIDKQYTITYKQNLTGGLCAPVKETWNVGVSTASKDLFGISTAPQSPYYESLTNKYFVTLANPVTGAASVTWANSSNSYYNLANAYSGWGMDNLNISAFSWWTQNNLTGSHALGPRFIPAISPGELNTFSSFVRDNDWQFSLYTIWGIMDSGNYYWNPNFNNLNQTGGFKQDAGARSLAFGQTINFKPLLDIAFAEQTALRNAYNLSAVFNDAETAAWPSDAAWDKLDQRVTGSNVKTLREGLIYHKLTLDAQRFAVDGPLLGEGPIASWHDAGFIFQGYCDGTQRAISTNSLLGPPSIPSGDPRCISAWPPVVDSEWYVQQPINVNLGIGFYDRFFSYSDWDVISQTGGPFTIRYPLSSGAMDRWRSFSFSHARAGYTYSNGYEDSAFPQITFEQTVTDYYITNAVQKRMFAAPVANIEYYISGSWSGFDDAIKVTKTTAAFSGSIVHITLEDGFELYVNHATGSAGTIIRLADNTETYNLFKDGFIARQPKEGFYAFTAAGGISGMGYTQGNKISYVYAPEEYEFFHGKGSWTGFGNIATSGSNSSQMKVHNFIHNTTIYSQTGVGTTYPQVSVVTGLV